MSYQKGFINILVIGVFSIFLIIIGTYFIVNEKVTPTSYNSILNPIPAPTIFTQKSKKAPNQICTQEAKQCPDGSYVSRTETNCEFAKCKEVNTLDPNQKQIILYEGQRESSLLVQHIYPDYITGLNYPEYPIATDQGYPITLYVGETASNGCTVTLTLINIESKKSVFIEKTDFNKICPICLAENTLIDTPEGNIQIQKLQKGMAVWTTDEFGKRIRATVIETSKVLAPSTHQVIHIILDDKRELFASPLHPVGDGRTMQDILLGDLLDGSRVISVKNIPYDKEYTYDILPSGKTGLYWANGILIDSTLH
ncbi:MAG: hypothetical protein UR31_C0015G0018 [Parcubacteria group bacterium GW2011_GWA2_33_14]|uniref:Hedgehog/Intein (Hint) domain-containing protein n=1 Tax=Candidatus Staskawiczbacteria bacterium RIFCSPHIGHO2_02_FULL_33_16 TaxID=1802204 RepID=A0A1G2HXB9_9BACT|nr:MAG: hypothetical protein UR31_C0015G0018 [Parcubacteria group bacterium GW2011_GWA2_33_14]OGZ67125.1 MAG: hypothetical protein A3D34_02520 [Candidatus Staskawiczbacteria bacterium RIFCSPHIGHO2_02_FULL_33_16]OGZ70945.1 MAG: hypothetical protein A2980_02970 [Candidatus Staskawiczbacteria bacterium RIFCSPLOWO2_01_FULL_33_13]